jgi:hypothetical protein
MNEYMTDKQLKRKRAARLARYFLPVILLLIVTSINLPSFPSRAPKQQTVTGQDDTAAIEEKYGIRIKRIAVLAGGGAVEFRFLIVDPEKANYYMHEPEFMPTLIAEDSGVNIPAPQGTHRNMVYNFGTGYHIMYSNPGGAVKSGTPITIAFEELQQRIIAQ